MPRCVEAMFVYETVSGSTSAIVVVVFSTSAFLSGSFAYRTALACSPPIESEITTLGLMLKLRSAVGNACNIQEISKILLKNAGGLSVANQPTSKFIREGEISKA